MSHVGGTLGNTRSIFLHGDCQGWHLAHTGRPLFSEHVEAWANGPVVATLWRAEAREDRPPPAPRDLLPDALETLGYVVSRYGKLTAQQLIDLTHAEDPWRDISRSEDEAADQLIPVGSLKAFFNGEIAAARMLAEQALRDPKTRTLISEAIERSGQVPGKVDDPEVIQARLEALG